MNAVKVCLLLACFAIFSLNLNGQIKSKIPSKINSDSIFYELTAIDSSTYLLKKGSTRIKVYLQADSSGQKQRVVKGDFRHINSKGLYLYFRPFIPWDSIDYIRFKPAKNRDGRGLVVVYSAYLALTTYFSFVILNSYYYYEYPLYATFIFLPLAIAPVIPFIATPNDFPVSLKFQKNTFNRYRK